VAKVIGATLAGKLEAEDRLRDGTTFSLDLTKRTSFYLTNVPIGGGKFATIPAFHTHNADQLLSHLGCVAHYNTTPSIANQSTHYANAIAAVRSIWNVGLVQGCTINSTVSYSTPAFTFVAAILEKVTGRNVARLLREELAQPYGLASLRIQWETGSLPANYERAAPYNNDNTETTYSDSTWKPLSGGMELNVIDLATFGWKVLNGQIVTPAVRDNRLFASVKAGCGTTTSGSCQYGLGWVRSTLSDRRIVDHDGSWTGARAFIRLYRDNGLVVAIMSNRTNHTKDGDVWGLATSIGNAVLAP
jgi:CubicO group peptidase (beta-lactamase class C family)